MKLEYIGSNGHFIALVLHIDEITVGSLINYYSLLPHHPFIY